jgi:hypothetical protein
MRSQFATASPPGRDQRRLLFDQLIETGKIAGEPLLLEIGNLRRDLLHHDAMMRHELPTAARKTAWSLKNRVDEAGQTLFVEVGGSYQGRLLPIHGGG